MGFRMRKSFKIAPGVRLNVSKRGVGASFGEKYGRYSVHSTGRRTVSGSTGIPGIWYQKSASGKGSRTPTGQTRRTASASAAPPPEKASKPGMFAPKGEKALYKAIEAQDPTAMRAAALEHDDVRLLGCTLAGLMLMGSDPPGAESLLDQAFASGKDPAEDGFAVKYLQTWVTIPLAPGVSAELPVDRDAIGLALAELKQERGALEEAIDTVEQLEPSTYAAVSLAELYATAKRYDDIIELTQALGNYDDASALLLTYRGMALRNKGFHDAAHEALKEALKSKNRSAAIRHLALIERSDNYLAQNKRAMAKKDLERIMAEDASVEGVSERLAAL